MTRIRSPTKTVSPQTLHRRCRETFQAAMKIHGGTKSNKRPALDGLYHTVSEKNAKLVFLVIIHYVTVRLQIISLSNVSESSWQNLNVQKIIYCEV